MDRLTATNRLNDGGRLLVENPQASELYAPLTNSIIPQRSMGAVSYTRATIATVTDHEWVIRQCLSGEARFQWARRVRNLTPYSQDVSILWNKFSVTVSWTKVAYTDGSLIGQTVVSAAASAVHYISNGIWPVIIWNTYLFSVSVKAAWVNFVQLAFAASTAYQNFDLTNWSMTGTAGAGSVVDEWNGWYRCTVKFVSTLGTNASQGIIIVPSIGWWRLFPYLWDGVSGISVCRMQLEDVTGQSIQTPSEYVSTNVLTTAPFHGAMVDWVKYFDTDINGIAIPENTLKGFLCEWARTNLFLQSEDFSTTWGLVGIGAVTTNQAIAPNGTMTADLFTLAASFGAQWVTQSLTTTASVYAQSIYVKSNGHNFVQCNADSGISLWYVNFDLSNGTVGTQSLWTGSIESLPNGWYRLRVVTNTISATTANVSFAAVPNANATRGQTAAGTGTSGFYIWGAQFELWAFRSSYIPTAAATVTRNIDALSYSVGNIIDLKWAVYCEIGVDIPWYTNLSWFIIDRWSNGRYIYANNSVTWVSNYDWTNILVSNIWSSYNGSVAKIATSWTGSTKSIYYGSTVPKTWVYDGTFWTGNINVGSSWNGTIRNVKVWKEPPTVAELTSITSI